jgi:hypothetical protein
MILNETVAAIADAIREKTGKSELIAPVDFAEEIKGITAGGGESGGDEWQYYDVRNTTLPEGQWEVMMTMFTTLVRATDDSSTIISGSGILAMYGIEEARQRLKYIAINMDVKQYNSMTNNQLLSFKEVEAISGQSIADMLATFGITPITKEQFYDLNA